MRISLKNGTRILSASCLPPRAFKSTFQLVPSSRGNRNSICSCRPGSVETSTSPSVRNVLMTPFKRGIDAAGVVDAQRGLRHIGDRRVGRDIERLDVLFALYQHHGSVDLAERALDFRMAGVADENEHASLGDVALALVVDLGNQRACRIEYRQLPSGRLVHHAFGDAVRAEDSYRALRHLGELF